ncbi:MAG: tetratricopeptide repeat protein [Armatimonadetes bacterium]|nr:tetratricopeptide repeat protein [Armatimonadota bacterium]
MDDEARLQQADKLCYDGDYDAAIAVYDDLLAGNPGQYLARFGRAKAWLFTGLFDEAIAEFEQLRADHPDFLKGRVELFKSYLMLSMVDEAKDEARAILKADPGNEEVHKQLMYLGDL